MRILKRTKRSKFKRLEVFLEFLIFGIAVGITEDLIAIKLVTGEPITWKVVGLVVLIAIPFAVIGEVLIDRIDFAAIMERLYFKRILSKRLLNIGKWKKAT